MSASDMSSFKRLGNETLNTKDGGEVDSNLQDFKDTQAPARPLDPIGQTSIPRTQYETATPDIMLPDTGAGFSSQGASEGGSSFIPRSGPVGNGSGTNGARAAQLIDLENMDESKLLDLPFIDAKSFDVPALLQIKPRDPAIRFRWVNYKNEEGGNLQKFKAIGYQNAVQDDVHPDTPVGENLILDGTTIKFYDVMLMKIGTIRLMQAYKANILKSLTMVGRSPERALKEAKRVWNNECSPDMIDAMKKAGLSVDFYTPAESGMRNDEDFDKAAKNIDFRV